MPPTNLLHIAEAVVASLKPETCTTSSFYSFLMHTLICKVPDETVLKLRSVFPDTLVLAAFDLVDRYHGKGPVMQQGLDSETLCTGTHFGMSCSSCKLDLALSPL